MSTIDSSEEYAEPLSRDLAEFLFESGSSRSRPGSEEVQSRVPEREKRRSTEESTSPISKERPKHFETKVTGLGPVKSLFNKLSPKNFERVSDQIRVYLAENQAAVELAAELVTEFAICQQFYSRTYSQLCSLLLKKLSKESAQAFRTRLGILCKRLFEVSENPNPNSGKHNAEEELDCIKKRKRYVALCTYIANLSLEGIFESRRVALCIKSLLEKRDEASLEAACALLQTAGQKLDQSVKTSPIGTKAVSDIYSVINEITERKLTSPRMTYLLLDIVELRDRGWKPRIPKDIPQCRK
ncbi:uncharacterized protein LOC143019027 [Oratosquilla oratoria]|uniref:uncharacterized protein LOC143019027 n=1 Tax=Oratosquilla oratoria TaxID=337810 RepID=UPI003F763917